MIFHYLAIHPLLSRSTSSSSAEFSEGNYKKARNIYLNNCQYSFKKRNYSFKMPKITILSCKGLVTIILQLIKRVLDLFYKSKNCKLEETYWNICTWNRTCLASTLKMIYLLLNICFIQVDILTKMGKSKIEIQK